MVMIRIRFLSAHNNLIIQYLKNNELLLLEEKYKHSNLKKDIDLIGLGNAIVDIIVNVDDEFLEVNNLKKGSMNPVSYTHLTLPTKRIV